MWRQDKALFVRVARALGIPYIVLADCDIQEIKEEWSSKRKENQREKNRKHEQWNKAILDAAGKEHAFWLAPTFEGALGLPKDESQKVDQALKCFANATEEDIPDCLKEPIRRLMEI